MLAPVASLLILIGNAITPGRGFREGPFSSDIELRELVDIAGSRGVVEETEREMLQSVFDLGDTIVREVMVPRTEVVWIEEDKSLRQALHLATRSGLSRIPVVGEDVDDVLGVAYIKDMIARALALEPGERGPMLGEVMRAPVFVPESKNVDALLREMQRDRTHFADRGRRVRRHRRHRHHRGLLEEIVGEITDEYDVETPAAGLRHARRKVGWHYGFAAAGVGMLIGLAIYLYAMPLLPPDELQKAKAGRVERTAADQRRMARRRRVACPVPAQYAVLGDVRAAGQHDRIMGRCQHRPDGRISSRGLPKYRRPGSRPSIPS